MLLQWHQLDGSVQRIYPSTGRVGGGWGDGGKKLLSEGGGVGRWLKKRRFCQTKTEKRPQPQAKMLKEWFGTGHIHGREGTPTPRMLKGGGSKGFGTGADESLMAII